MSKNIAIILVNWNGFALTHDCICSLQQSSYTDFDIIVVDNGSTDGSVEKLRALFSTIILLESAINLGFTGGNNLAMQYAIQQGYRYSFLLNNDTFVDPEFLAPLVSYMQAHPKAGAVQPKIHFAHNRQLLWNAGSYFNRWLGITYIVGYAKKDADKYQTPKKVDWITGCAFFVRNQVLQQTGLFTDSFFTYYEDVDLSFRIVQKGYELHYVPQSVVYHIAGMSGKTVEKGKEGFLNAQVHYYNVRNRIWIIKQYVSPAFLPFSILYHTFYFGAMLLYFLLRGRFEKFAVCCKAIKHGLKGRMVYLGTDSTV